MTDASLHQTGAADPGTIPASSIVQAILTEISAMLVRLAETGETGQIDLSAMPILESDRAALEVELGRGEVAAALTVAGPSEVFETAYSGVWWISHRAAQDRLTSETIEITPVPEILASHAADIRAAAARLSETINENADESAA